MDDALPADPDAHLSQLFAFHEGDAEAVLCATMDSLVGGRFAPSDPDSGQNRVHNAAFSRVIVRSLLPRLDAEQQLRLLGMLVALLEADEMNAAACCAVGLGQAVVDVMLSDGFAARHLERGGQLRDSLLRAGGQLLAALLSHSASVADVHAFLRPFHPGPGGDVDVRAALLDALLAADAVARAKAGEDPTAFVDLARLAPGGLALPPLPGFDRRGYSFVARMRLAPRVRGRREMLFTLHARGFQGVTALLHGPALELHAKKAEGGGFAVVTALDSVPVGRWFWLALVHRPQSFWKGGDRLDVFVDGQLAHSRRLQFPAGEAPLEDCRIGAAAEPLRALRGHLACAAIVSAALAPEDVQQLADKGTLAPLQQLPRLHALVAAAFDANRPFRDLGPHGRDATACSQVGDQDGGVVARRQPLAHAVYAAGGVGVLLPALAAAGGVGAPRFGPLCAPPPSPAELPKLLRLAACVVAAAPALHASLLLPGQRGADFVPDLAAALARASPAHRSPELIDALCELCSALPAGGAPQRALLSGVLFAYDLWAGSPARNRALNAQRQFVAQAAAADVDVRRVLDALAMPAEPAFDLVALSDVAYALALERPQDARALVAFALHGPRRAVEAQRLLLRLLTGGAPGALVRELRKGRGRGGAHAAPWLRLVRDGDDQPRVLAVQILHAYARADLASDAGLRAALRAALLTAEAPLSMPLYFALRELLLSPEAPQEGAAAPLDEPSVQVPGLLLDVVVALRRGALDVRRQALGDLLRVPAPADDERPALIAAVLALALPVDSDPGAEGLAVGDAVAELAARLVGTRAALLELAVAASPGAAVCRGLLFRVVLEACREFDRRAWGESLELALLASDFCLRDPETTDGDGPGSSAWALLRLVQWLWLRLAPSKRCVAPAESPRPKHELGPLGRALQIHVLAIQRGGGDQEEGEEWLCDPGCGLANSALRSPERCQVCSRARGAAGNAALDGVMTLGRLLSAGGGAAALLGGGSSQDADEDAEFVMLDGHSEEDLRLLLYLAVRVCALLRQAALRRWDAGLAALCELERALVRELSAALLQSDSALFLPLVQFEWPAEVDLAADSPEIVGMGEVEMLLSHRVFVDAMQAVEEADSEHRALLAAYREALLSCASAAAAAEAPPLPDDDEPWRARAPPARSVRRLERTLLYMGHAAGAWRLPEAPRLCWKQGSQQRTLKLDVRPPEYAGFAMALEEGPREGDAALPQAPVRAVSSSSDAKEEEEEEEEEDDDLPPPPPDRQPSVDWEEVDVEAADDDDAVLYVGEAELVLPLCVVAGRFEVRRSCLFFAGERVLPAGGGDGDDEECDAELLTDGDALRPRRWALDDLTEIYQRRYMLRLTALELFVRERKSVLLHFHGRAQPAQVHRAILSAGPRALQRHASRLRSPQRLVRAADWQAQWVDRRMSTFDYLMHLNAAAGRTFRDLTQYPVFPWVIADYESARLDLDDPAVYRDLSKPVGALNPERLQHFVARSESLAEMHAVDPSMPPPFLYGSHYSSVGTVLYFLLRLAPFSRYAVHLQSGHFDHADRLFHSVAETWRGCLNNTSDLKELVPEFFSQPDFLRNVNGLPLGDRQDGVTVDDVILPPWASSPEEFVSLQRQALESEFVSAHLHEWIDLIFGAKQRGPAAAEAHNVFYHLTYEDAVDIDAITDPVERRAAQVQIANFGQTPCQLFSRPHPQRRPLGDAFPAALLQVPPLGGLAQRVMAPLPATGVPAKALWFTGGVFCSALLADGGVLAAPFRLGPLAFAPTPAAALRPGPGPAPVVAQAVVATRTVVESTVGGAAAANGVLVVGRQWDAALKVRSLRSGDVTHVVRMHAEAHCLAAHGPLVACGCEDGAVVVWRSVDLTAPCFALAGMDGGDDNEGGGGGGAGGGVVGLLRTAAQTLVRKRGSRAAHRPVFPLQLLAGHASGAVSAVAVDADLGLVLSASDGALLVHTLRDGALLHRLPLPDAAALGLEPGLALAARAVAIAAGGHLLATVGAHLLLYGPSGRLLHCVALGREPVPQLLTSPNGQFLVLAFSDHAAIHRVPCLSHVCTLEAAPPSPICSVALDPRCVALGMADGTVAGYGVDMSRFR